MSLTMSKPVREAFLQETAVPSVLVTIEPEHWLSVDYAQMRLG